MQLLPRHIPQNTAPSTSTKLSVDIYTLESMSLSHIRRDMPMLSNWVATEPRWVLFEKPLKVADNTVPNLFTGDVNQLKVN